ncbi:MAG: PIN domain-containing protein [Desulfotignum sp.]|jgi:predicted nucleic acid-binding protein|nr:PIN domain-containing protein [Desulfotignum sp.]
MRVLIDSSVWIDYFRSGNQTDELDHLIDSNLVFVNDLILTELIPFLRLQNQTALIDIINEVVRLPMSIDWQQIQSFQFICLKNGINGIGIPDLIIVQNAIQNNSEIFSLDKYFKLMQDSLNFKLY